MGWKNKVIWSEGLFLQPHHFQQQERYVESLAQTGADLAVFPWGFYELKIDSGQLKIGKLAIERASGILPDGTPFNIPHDTPAPPAIDLPRGQQNYRAYLALPLARDGGLDVDLDNSGLVCRYRLREDEINDVVTDPKNSIDMQLGALNFRILTENDAVADYSALGLVHIAECDANGETVVDESYIPPVLSYTASPKLTAFVQELLGLIKNRGEMLVKQQLGGGGGSSGTAGFLDFVMLLVINRHEPLISHLQTVKRLHPEALFRVLISLAGELSTISHSSRRPDAFPEYQHDELGVCFQPVLDDLRNSFGMVSVPKAEQINLDEPKYGIRRAAVGDRTLLEADFVLAVKANLAVDELRARFVTQSKVGAVENIRDLVMAALPGIPLVSLPVVPAEIPYHQGFVYFQLDRQSEHWPDKQTSTGFAIHVVGDLPGLSLEFWAIRRVDK